MSVPHERDPRAPEDPEGEDGEHLLGELGRELRARLVARARAWEAVTDGERTAEDVAAERLAAGDPAAQVERAKALFRPFDASENEVLVNALLEHRARETARSRERPRTVWRFAIAGALAASLSTITAVGGRTLYERLFPIDEPVIATLSPYRIEADTGLSATRGDPEPSQEVPVYRQDSTFTWVLRPASSVEGELEVRIYAHATKPNGAEAARLVPHDGWLESTPGGSMRLQGSIRQLGLEPGDWTIVIVIGRPLVLAAFERVPLEDTSEYWTVLRHDLRIEPDEPLTPLGP